MIKRLWKRAASLASWFVCHLRGHQPVVYFKIPTTVGGSLYWHTCGRCNRVYESHVGGIRGPLAVD